MLTHTDDGAIRGIAHLAAADATALALITRLAQARIDAVDRTPEEAATLTDIADLDAANLIERYAAGGTRSLRHLIDALADLATDGWCAVSRLLDVDPEDLMGEADRHRG